MSPFERGDESVPGPEQGGGRSGRPDWPRSYLRRQGHVTRAQKRALRELWTRYGLDAPHGTVLDLDEAFGRRGSERVLDVGFGMGDTLLARALAQPERDLLGVEVHRPGLGAALLKIEEHGLGNVRVVRHDVFELLWRHVEAESFDEVTIFFPEPWPKPNQQAKRLVRPLLLKRLERAMRPGGSLLIATDVEAYAEHALSVLTARGAPWRNLSEREDGTVERCAWRPVTPYEQKGLDEGRAIFDLHFKLG